MTELQSRTELVRFSALDRLEAAYRSVLGEKFETELRAIAEPQSWYRAQLGESETFRLWALNSLTSHTQSEWLFEPLRVSERRLFMLELGIIPEEIVGKGPEELGALCLNYLGIPLSLLSGAEAFVKSFKQIREMVLLGSDERAAIMARQKAERILKYLLHFYCSTPLIEYFISMLSDPGRLQVPRRLLDAINAPMAQKPSEIRGLFIIDDWADLGFLALALRKFSTRLEEALELHPSGSRLILLTALEHETFNKLGNVLQSYTHDKPTALANRQPAFRDAVSGIEETLRRMIERQVLPSEHIVIETGQSIGGNFFRARDLAGKVRSFSTAEPPTLGTRIAVIASTEGEYAACTWTRAVW